MQLSRSQCEMVAILAAPFCFADSCTRQSNGHYTHPGSTLLALAQTSRAVSLAARQELWRTIPSLECFTYVLPLDLWKVDPPGTNDDDDEDDEDEDDKVRRYYVSIYLLICLGEELTSLLGPTSRSSAMPSPRISSACEHIPGTSRPSITRFGGGT